MRSGTRFARVQLLLAQLLAQLGPFSRAQVPGRCQLCLFKHWQRSRMVFARTLRARGHTQFAPHLLTVELTIGLMIGLTIPPWRPARPGLCKSCHG